MRYLPLSLSTLVLVSVWVQAQPVPAPESGDAPCEDPPTESVETDMTEPDAEGFHSLFNGNDFSGWWNNCGTGNSSGGDSGAIFRVDPERKALYTTQRGRATGGVLMTKAKFTDYELEFDYWPDWGNEAGVLHRSNFSGRAYNMTLSYLAGASLGGVWGEGGFTSRDYRPFSFSANESTLVIPGSGQGEPSNWTTITRNLKAAGETVPCPDTGCTQEDWRRLWDFDGWNQIRMQFRGARDGRERLYARSWFRKPGVADWVPLSPDTTLLASISPGYIGLVVHGHGRFSGPRGTWYRNIRWKPWTPSTTSKADLRVMETFAHRPANRVDRARQGIRVTFAEAAIRRDIRVLSLDGKSMATLREVRGEAFLSTAGWPRGVYLIRTDADGSRDWARILLP